MPIIGTRGSLLAPTQAGHVRDALTSHGYPSELRIVTTTGELVWEFLPRRFVTHY